jgi:DNA-binding GntR family transcriptional regulator
MAVYVTKNDLVYKKLKNEIITGKLRPGERIVVAEVAQRYQVSPMPVREALVRLQQDELVCIIPHMGAKVMAFNVKKFLEITAIRVEIETLAARLATNYLSENEIEQLDVLINNMKQALEEKDVIAYEEFNRKFHETIYAACGNQQLYELILSLWEKTEISRTIFYRLSDRTAISFIEHQQWLEAIKERAADKVASVVRKHKENAFQRLSEVMEKEAFEMGI